LLHSSVDLLTEGFQPVNVSRWRFVMSFLRALVAAGFVFALVHAFGQTTADQSLTESSVYRKSCAKCHGRTAEGRHFGGPSLISEKTTSKSEEDLRNIITEGKGRMPKFGAKLGSTEIDTLIKQIRASGPHN